MEQKQDNNVYLTCVVCEKVTKTKIVKNFFGDWVHIDNCLAKLKESYALFNENVFNENDRVTYDLEEER